VSYGVCEAWVCAANDIEALLAIKPKIGGMFSNLGELLSNSLATKLLRDYMTTLKLERIADILVAGGALKQEQSGGPAQKRKLSDIYKKYLEEGAPKLVEQVPEELLQSIRNAVGRGDEREAVEQLDAVLKHLSGVVDTEVLPGFMNSEAYHKMLLELHQRHRTKLNGAVK